MKFDTIHETVLRDITDAITGVDVDKIARSVDFGGSTPSIAHASSLSKATSGLTLVFPVLCDKSNPISTATMISKAVERKAVTLLQVALGTLVYGIMLLILKDSFVLGILKNLISKIFNNKGKEKACQK